MTATTKGQRQRLPEQGKLSQEALEARRKYQRDYRRRNPEKRRQWDARRWEKLAEAARKEKEHDE